MFKAYYRLTKPGIIYGNALTVIGGYLLAASHAEFILSSFMGVVFGTSLVIAAACVYNNYIDRAIDRLMARTKQRALASGVISNRRALLFGSVLGILGFVILVTSTNRLTVGIGLIALADYVLFYGLAKRRSWHGTLVGTIAGSAPLVAGYVAVTDQFDLGALLLLLTMTAWQMAHFYAIALYRLDDYRQAHIPVISIVKGVKTTKRQIMWYIVVFGGANALLSIYSYTSYSFGTIMVGISLVWLARGWQGYAITDSVTWGRRLFSFSLIVLLGFCLALSLNSLLSKYIG